MAEKPAEVESRLALLAALSIPRIGKVFELARVRHPGMPLPELHPPLTVLPYRTPQGLLGDPQSGWPSGEDNVRKIAFTSELVSMTMHTGTHIDALGHISRGDPPIWRGGSESRDRNDFGITGGSASELSPLITRAVLIDMPGLLGIEYLPAGEGVSAVMLEEALRRRNQSIEPGDVVLIRTGMGSLWPEPDRMKRAAGAGITLDAAEMLAACGVAAVGADTEAVEQLPSTTPGNPHPVHERLLLEEGIPLIEMLHLEELARNEPAPFLFIASPVRIAGTTAGLVDPVAII